jgi:uncharacterized membrane protein YfcA
MEGNSAMQDSQKDSPSQPIWSNHAPCSADDASLEEDNGEYEPAESQLPSNSLLYTFLVGGLTGLVAAFLHIAITFINAPLYNEAAHLADKMSSNMAGTIAALGCLNVFIDLALSFAVGYVVGRIAVLRRRGALAGACFGAVSYLAGFIVRYLPNYPGRMVSDVSPSSGVVFAGIVTSIIILLIYSAMGALLALWGAWSATRKHPYYYQRWEQE